MGQNNENEKRYVILTQDILEDDRMNFAEKIILARITGFKVFYESSTETAKMLHTSELVVQRAKRKLEQLGYIQVIENTGRGKKYCANLWKSQVRPNKNVLSDLTKKSGQIGQKCQTYNKKKIKEKEKGDDNVAADVENSKKEYGRSDINELVALWESETGISIKGQQNERRQLYNLLRKYGLDATKTLVKRVGATRRSRDRFAPQIAVPSDLTGKYSKLPRLQLWEDRNKASRPFGEVANTTLAAIKGNEGWNKEAWDEPSDDERAKVREMFKKARGDLFKS